MSDFGLEEHEIEALLRHKFSAIEADWSLVKTTPPDKAGEVFTKDTFTIPDLDDAEAMRAKIIEKGNLAAEIYKKKFGHPYTGIYNVITNEFAMDSFEKFVWSFSRAQILPETFHLWRVSQIVKSFVETNPPKHCYVVLLPPDENGRTKIGYLDDFVFISFFITNHVDMVTIEAFNFDLVNKTTSEKDRGGSLVDLIIDNIGLPMPSAFYSKNTIHEKIKEMRFFSGDIMRFGGLFTKSIVLGLNREWRTFEK